MKTLKHLSILFVAILTFSCSTDDDTNPVNTDDLNNLEKIQELSNDSHIVELYSESGILQQGYNAISLRIKDKNSDNFVTDASINWNPIMYMTDKQHSCPKSEVVKSVGKQNLYNGYIIFQMASNDSEYWKLTIDYSINGNDYSVSETIQVESSDKQRVTSFMGTDNVRYVLAIVEPSSPAVAVNDMIVGLFRMENMMNFSVVDDYTIKIDPRMPSMGNHGSPNNVDLTQKADGFYHGKLSLTMTGYWKINLQLLNQTSEVLKGEEVTENNESSSLYLEIEF
ncbi:MAG: hypothetical protein WCY06_09055 [Flavobacteriaceae bacterium]